MEPSHADIEIIRSAPSPFEATIAWVGIQPGVLAALRSELGHFSVLRELMYIEASEWTAAGLAATILVPDSAEGDPAARKLTAVERGHVGALRRAASAVLGLSADSGGTAD